MHYGARGIEPAEPDESDPNTWKLGEVVEEAEFQTDGAGNQTLSFKLPVGVFRAVLETRDRFGEEVKALLPLEVIDPQATELAVKLPQRLRSEKQSLQPGETFRAVWGSG